MRSSSSVSLPLEVYITHRLAVYLQCGTGASAAVSIQNQSRAHCSRIINRDSHVSIRWSVSSIISRPHQLHCRLAPRFIARIHFPHSATCPPNAFCPLHVGGCPCDIHQSRFRICMRTVNIFLYPGPWHCILFSDAVWRGRLVSSDALAAGVAKWVTDCGVNGGASGSTH